MNQGYEADREQKIVTIRFVGDQEIARSSKRQVTTSLLHGDEAARRCAALLDQERKNDHLHPRLGDLVAVDQAFAARDGFFNQRAIAARMRAAMPVSS